MLADGRGLLAKFRSSASLSNCILQVVGNPERQAEMERKTLAFGKDMMWSRVADRYLSIFRDAANPAKGGTANG